ncbi:rhodanese-like domain-containing protein [Candidatus Uhrbacteria bacterium]|nr:rhodanese-like domain-containing protein [Candidatus Uhrbacteria bacterium]
MYIDVRDAEELESGFIPDAIHIPVAQLENIAPIVLPDKQAEIICYCQTGRRSKVATDILKRLGYTHASSLDGGYEKWKLNT